MYYKRKKFILTLRSSPWQPKVPNIYMYICIRKYIYKNIHTYVLVSDTYVYDAVYILLPKML